MSVLNGKKILLGVTGGIAAYKTAALVRLFIKAGAEVQVIMTPSAKDFVTPLTLATLSKNPVYSDFISEIDGTLSWNNHVSLGLWPDIFIIAPATSNTISKMCSGACDNLLMASYMSSNCSVFVAPAMDLDMYIHPATVRNFQQLEANGVSIIPSESGELASGLVGEGRMAEPEHIVDFIENQISESLVLKNKKIVITAGPTYEPIDPVRFIGNHSTGKMGFDLASYAVELGAEVVLVSGPSSLMTPKGLNRINVFTAEEMYSAVNQHIHDADIFISAAAVADYRPKSVSNQKIKKNADDFIIELEKNTDILASVGALEKKPFLVGFALETENEIAHAKQKIQKKNLDLIVLNSLNDKGAGFGTPTNKVYIINKEGIVDERPLQSKEDTAKDILNKIVSVL